MDKIAFKNAVFYIMPHIGHCSLVSSDDTESLIVPEPDRRSCFFSHRILLDGFKKKVLEVYYEWLPVPWFYFRICTESERVFSRFRPLFCRHIVAKYVALKGATVRYKIFKKDYRAGLFKLENELGEVAFIFSQKDYERSGVFSESLFKLEFKYRFDEEKLFFLGLALCIPEAIDLFDPRRGD